MKKSLLAVSSLILVFAVTLSSCGKNSVYKDEYGNTHVAATEKGGVTKQDKFGNLYEVVTDVDGKTKTQVAKFPDVMTNKSNSWIENGVLHIDVPKGWETSGSSQKIILHHAGECTDTGTPRCELTFTHSTMSTVEEEYAKYLKNVKYLIDNSGECSELKEYETKLLGTTVKAISYKLDKSNIYSYCYFVQKEIPIIRIETYAYDKCYTEDELIALLEECVTLKELGGEIPTTTTTATAKAD